MTHTFFPRNLFIVLPALFIILSGCEITTDPGDLPYLERIVVRGVIETGKPVDSIMFTRTLPLTETYTHAAAMLTDVDATIIVDGISHPLKHVGSGYYAATDLVIEAGQVYQLNASWHGKNVTASTLAPAPVTVDSVAIVLAYESNDPDFPYIQYSLQAIFTPHQQQVYGVGSRIEYRSWGSGGVYTRTDELDRWDNIARRRDTLSDGKIHLDSESWFDKPEPLAGDSVYAILYSYDEPYYDYFQTRYHNDFDDDGIFSNGGSPVHWNVQGDGIGMFIGRAVSETLMRD